MSSRVIFRDFRESDISTVFQYKNDVGLNAMIVGKYAPFSMEDAAKWVHGCMRSDPTYRFWAIATNDEHQDLVGWLGIAKIDEYNKSVDLHSIFIGHPAFHDGLAWIEAYLFVMKYVFDTLHMHRLWGTRRVDHLQTMAIGEALYWRQDGTLRDAKWDGSKFIDISIHSLLHEEYFEHLANGDYEIRKVRRRIAKYLLNHI